MTKTKMRSYLRYQLEQLNRTTDIEKYYKRTGELFFKLRSMPYKDDRLEHFNKLMDMWETHIYNRGMSVEFNAKMRKVSSNKKYLATPFGIRFKKDAYDLIKHHIDWSLLPNK
jgi:hypothetical protein